MSKILSNTCGLYLGKYDLAIGGRESSLAGEKPAGDITTVADASEQAMMGAVGKTVLDFSGLYDSAATADYIGLKTLVGSNTASVVSMHLGNTVGNDAIITQVKVKAVKSSVRFKELLPVSGDFDGQQFPDYGYVAYPKTTITATTNATYIDGAAQSANGAVWAYHIMAVTATGGNAQWIITVQDDDNTGFATPATLDTVNVASGATGSARRVIAGTVQRYTRLVFTLDATSGSITVAGTWQRT